MIKPPCYDCDSRSAQCHATCQRYAVWAKKRSEAKDRRWTDAIADDFLKQQNSRRKKLPDSRLKRGDYA